MQVAVGIPNGAIVLMIIVLILVLLFGMTLAGTELFSPELSRAKAQQIEQQNYLQSQQGALALKFQEKRQEQILSAERERQRIELALLEVGGTVLILTCSIAILLVGFGLAVYLICLGRKNLVIAAMIASGSSPSPTNIDAGEYKTYRQGYRRDDTSISTAKPSGDGNGTGETRRKEITEPINRDITAAAKH